LILGHQTVANVKVFGHNFLEGTIPIVSAMSQYNRVCGDVLPPFGKDWLGFVCWSEWSLSAKLGNEVEYRIYGGRVKTPVMYIITFHSEDIGR